MRALMPMAMRRERLAEEQKHAGPFQGGSILLCLYGLRSLILIRRVLHLCLSMYSAQKASGRPARNAKKGVYTRKLCCQREECKEQLSRGSHARHETGKQLPTCLW